MEQLINEKQQYQYGKARHLLFILRRELVSFKEKRHQLKLFNNQIINPVVNLKYNLMTIKHIGSIKCTRPDSNQHVHNRTPAPQAGVSTNFTTCAKIISRNRSQKKTDPNLLSGSGLNTFGDLAGARTQDPLLKREMLYQLSYQVN